MLKRHRKLIILFILLIVFSGVGFLGYEMAADEPRIVKSTQAPAAAPAGADNARVKEGAQVNWDYEYTMCAHHIYVKSAADNKIVGLSITQLQATFPDIRIVSFDPDKLTLHIAFNCYCPDHYILRHYKDQLAVYKTIPYTGDQEVYIEVPIQFNGIDGEEQKVLETGKVFDNIEDLESYLENIDQT